MDHGIESMALTVAELKDKELHFDQDAFEQLLSRFGVKDIPIAVLAIVGKARKGKSFLMNLLAQYLEQCGFQNAEWVSNESSVPVDNCFEWKAGRDVVTKGINLWSKIYTFQTPNVGKFGILLLDTQGLFTSNQTQDAKIFSMSLLMSSILVFNIPQVINAKDLEVLQFYTDYACKISGRDAEKSYQNLLFLVRDWKFESDMPFGIEGGTMYLEKVLHDYRGHQAFLDKCFENVDCFLMPHVGKKCIGKGFQGHLKDVNEVFLEQIKHLGDFLLQPKNIYMKRVNERNVTAENWLALVKTWVASMNDDPRTFKPMAEVGVRHQ